MAEIGIQPDVIEAVVNHVSGHKAGVGGIYNRATYAEEKRAALTAVRAGHLYPWFKQMLLNKHARPASSANLERDSRSAERLA